MFQVLFPKGSGSFLKTSSSFLIPACIALQVWNFECILATDNALDYR